MSKHGIIRTIYLYLFSIIGLVLIIISGVRFIDMGLKAFVFKQAEEEQKFYYSEPPYLPVAKERLAVGESGADNQICLTREESESVKSWAEEYNYWSSQRNNFDFIASKRHRDASISLAMLIIGLPVYLYHWGTIKKDIREEKEDKENKA